MSDKSRQLVAILICGSIIVMLSGFVF